MTSPQIFHDHFQNFKKYNIPKAQLILTDIPYNLGNNAYASNPVWYEGGKIRFINNKDFTPIDYISRNKQHFGLAKNSSLESQNLLEIYNKINNNKNKDNKNKLHPTKLDVIFSSYGICKSDIEKRFSFSKSLGHIELCLVYIKEISAELDILPVYNKDTINATSILINKGYYVKDIIKIVKDDNRDVGAETYQDLIRNDYYLPATY